MKTYTDQEVINFIYSAIHDINSGNGIEVTRFPDGTTESVEIEQRWIDENIKNKAE